jgi:hypothetical protein
MYIAKIKNLRARKVTKSEMAQYHLPGYVVNDKEYNHTFSVGECIDRRHAILIVARGGGEILDSFSY